MRQDGCILGMGSVTICGSRQQRRHSDAMCLLFIGGLTHEVHCMSKASIRQRDDGRTNTQRTTRKNARHTNIN